MERKSKMLPKELRNKLHKVTIEKIRFAISTTMSPALIDEILVDTYIDHASQRIIQIIKMFLLGKEVSKSVVDTIQVPASPWDFFKEKYFPEFLKKWFPIKMISHNVIFNHYHVCPHIDVKSRGACLTFLSTNKNYGDKFES